MSHSEAATTVGEYLTVGQAAAFLGVSPWTLRNWDRAGKLKPERQSSNGYRIYRREELEALSKRSPGLRLSDRLPPQVDWAEIGDGEHVVQFYEHESYLALGVSQFLAAGLEAGHAGLVVATAEHRAAILQKLQARGVDVSPSGALARDERLVMVDAEELLERLMVKGAPDTERFTALLEGELRRLSRNKRKVRIFGEMVALLWARGDHDAAIRLERFWDELGRKHAFALLCAYPITTFARGQGESALEDVCSAHTRVIPAESYGLAGSDEQRLRVISRLQQRAQALEEEIARRQQAESALARRERELSDFLDNAVEGLHRVGPDGRILWANKAELALLGYQPEEYIGHHISEFHVDRDVIDGMLVKLRQGDSLRDHPARLRAKDGSLKHVLISSNAYIEDGRFVYTRCFTRDITERRYIEIQHNELRNRLAAIVESSDDAIVSKTLEGIVRTWNVGAQRIFGYTPEEAIGKSIEQLIIPEDRREEEPQILARLARGERVDHYETVRRTKQGRLIDVSVTISPVRNDRGEIIGASKIARDISAQKQMMAELEHAKEAAEDASKAKDHFLGVLSHELRTPLMPALAELSFLETESTLGPDLRNQIRMVRRNVETQARLVDDLLDVTRIARGKLSLHFEALDVHELLRNVIAMFQPQAEAKSIRVESRLGAKRHHIWADPGRMQQVFFNLMSNALKFTHTGGTILFETGNDAASHVRITVSDNGSGIDPALLPRLFIPFEQAPQSRRFGGLGLGLSIVQSLVKMHLGTISAHSEGRDKGATFTVELGTIDPPARIAEPESRPQFTQTYRILLVEDHADTRSVLTRLLRSFGHEVTAVGSVAEGLSAAEAKPFDLLMSDLGLPDGSGLELMEKLRDRGIKAIALSGYGLDEDIERSRAAGFTMHLTKPINIHVLGEVIHKTME